MEKSRPEIDESVGCEKSSGDRGLPRQPIVLIHGVEGQQRQHSSSCHRANLFLDCQFSLFLEIDRSIYLPINLVSI